MVWCAFCHLFSCLVDLFTVRRLADTQKDIQILLLRQQVRVLQHKARQPKRFSQLEKTLLYDRDAEFALVFTQVFAAQYMKVSIYRYVLQTNFYTVRGSFPAPVHIP